MVHSLSMETHTKEKRSYRPRDGSAKTAGTVQKTMQDALGFAEPLARYGELTSKHLCGLYNAINGLPEKSTYALNRLTRLIQNTKGMPTTRLIAIRPKYQSRHGVNHPDIYRRCAGTLILLAAKKIYPPNILSLADSTQVVTVPASEEDEPMQHDSSLAVVTSSFEILARRSPLIKSYKTHLDILAIASDAARAAHSPLSIPIPKLTHRFPLPSPDPKAQTAFVTETIQNIHVKPDVVHALEYTNGKTNFLTPEYDRSTEDVEPTRNLKRASWVRKILSYSAISVHPNPIYRSYLGMGNCLVPCYFHDARRMRHVMSIAQKYAAYPPQFLFMTIPYVDHLDEPPILRCVFEDDYLRPDGSKFNISTLKEVR